ncbi:TPA: hypothetical protein TXJ16_001324 [Streptococcus suis]|nr:hypothetical protein [Streptococcus suis]
MKIRIPLYTQRLNQAEFTQLITSSVDTLKQYRSSTNDPMVTDLINQLEESLPTLKKSLKQKRGSDMTSDLNKAVKNRKADYSAFVNGLKLFKNTRTPEKLQAYHRLQELIKLYKYTRSSNMQESSALIDSLLARLAKSPYSEDVSLLLLDEAVANLRESHESAYRIYLNRSQDTSTREKINSLEVRKAALKHYTLLYSHLVNKISYDPTAPEKVILQVLNDIRQDFSERTRQKNQTGANTATINIVTTLPQGKELEAR